MQYLLSLAFLLQERGQFPQQTLFPQLTGLVSRGDSNSKDSGFVLFSRDLCFPEEKWSSSLRSSNCCSETALSPPLLLTHGLCGEGANYKTCFQPTRKKGAQSQRLAQRKALARAGV